MSFRGDLEAFHLTSIMQLLYEESKTGVLKVTHKDREAVVLLQEGNVIYAKGTHEKYRLGALLLNQDLLTKGQLMECLTEAKEKKSALGKVLIAKGYIKDEALQAVIQKQAEEIIFDLFFWEHGEFEYKDATLNLDGLVVSRLSIMKLVMEASRRVDEMAIIRKQIPDETIILYPVAPKGGQEGIKLSALEKRVLGFIDGHRSVRDVLQSSGLDDFPAYQALHSLLSSGLIERRDGLVGWTEKDIQSLTETVSSFSEVVEVLWNQSVDVLGALATAIFESCKPGSTREQKLLFQGFIPDGPSGDNARVVIETAKGTKDPQRVKSILISSFNTYIKTVLNELTGLLRSEAMEFLLFEVAKLMPDLRDRGGEEGARVAATIGQILEEAQIRIGQKTMIREIIPGVEFLDN